MLSMIKRQWIVKRRIKPMLLSLCSSSDKPCSGNPIVRLQLKLRRREAELLHDPTEMRSIKVEVSITHCEGETLC